MRKKQEIEKEEVEEQPIEPKKVKDILGGVKIENPLKDFRITQNNFDIVIKQGEPVTVPQKFLQNLVTEKVIEKIPK